MRPGQPFGICGEDGMEKAALVFREILEAFPQLPDLAPIGQKAHQQNTGDKNTDAQSQNSTLDRHTFDHFSCPPRQQKTGTAVFPADMWRAFLKRSKNLAPIPTGIKQKSLNDNIFRYGGFSRSPCRAPF
jgi:hypothetical protein